MRLCSGAVSVRDMAVGGVGAGALPCAGRSLTFVATLVRVASNGSGVGAGDSEGGGALPLPLSILLGAGGRLGSQWECHRVSGGLLRFCLQTGYDLLQI